MNYLETLNEQQYRAVTTDSQYVRVNAGAGSGKTRVLAARIAHLIQVKGVYESQILAITFTNKVANEMKTRIASMLETDKSSVRIHTFHSFCVRFLREEIAKFNPSYNSNFAIYDDQDQESLVKRILKFYNIPKEEISPKVALAYISNMKNQGVDAIQAMSKATLGEEEKKATVYMQYEEELGRSMALDFDDLIVKAVSILEYSEDTRQKWQKRLRHILIDEFQDTNNLQYRLLRYLCNEQTNVFVVGDPDQTIYSWRGANVNLIINFNRHYPCEDIVLFQNYRSTPQILEVANKLIKHNKSRIPKDLEAVSTSGAPVVVFTGQNEVQEAQYVVEKIAQLRALDPTLTYHDFAVLYRSNYYTRNFEQVLLRYRTPYRIFGGLRFFQRKEVKDCLAYLRLATNFQDNQAFLRIVNEPRRGFGDKSLNELEMVARHDNCSLFEALCSPQSKKKDPLIQFSEAIKKASAKLENKENLFSDVLDELLDELKYLDQYRDSEETERLDNINEFKSYLLDIQKTNPDSTLLEILQDIPVMSAQDEISEGDYLSLMTVHTAKGLEFPYVFVVGLSEGNFPNGRALGEDPFAIEEERRLCYVAMTRAKKRLFLLNCEGFDYISQCPRTESRFFQESGLRKGEKKAPKAVPTQQAFHKDPNQANNYRLGNTVEHIAFGRGVIIDMDDKTIRVTFRDEQYGTKVLVKTFKGIKIIN